MTVGSSGFVFPGLLLIFNLVFIIFAALYFIFSLVIIRQVSLMAETVKTELGGVIRLVSVLFSLLALVILIFFIKSLWQ